MRKDKYIVKNDRTTPTMGKMAMNIHVTNPMNCRRNTNSKMLPERETWIQ